MTNLILASLFLPLSHFLLASEPLRGGLVRRVGERIFSAGYSIIAFLAFTWIVWGYRAAPTVPLWQSPGWLPFALGPFMALASVLVAAGLTTPNPVSVQSDRLFDRPDIVRGVLRISRNPFFWGMGIFAAAHLAMLGDARAVAAFGSVALLGFVGAPLLDAKKAHRHGATWQAFAAASSDIPFLAILQGRQRLSLSEIGWWRLVLAAALFLATLALHPGVIAPRAGG